MRDTTREARAAQVAAQQRLGPARRVELAFEMSEQAREIAIQGALARDPTLTPAEARPLVRRRVLGDALADAAWPRGESE